MGETAAEPESNEPHAATGFDDALDGAVQDQPPATEPMAVASSAAPEDVTAHPRAVAEPTNARDEIPAHESDVADAPDEPTAVPKEVANTPEVPALVAVDDTTQGESVQDGASAAKATDDIPAEHELPAEAFAASEPATSEPAASEPATSEPAASQPSADLPAEDEVPAKASAGDAHEHPAAVAQVEDPERETGPVASIAPTKAAPAAIGTTTAREPATAEHRRRTTTLLAGVAAIAAVVAVVVALAMFFGRSSGHKSAGAGASTSALTTSASSSPTPTGPSTSTPTSTPTSSSSDGGASSLPPQTQLGRWAKANLSPASIIVADAQAAKTLRANGFSNVIDDTSTTTDWRTVAYLVRGSAGVNPSALRVKLARAAGPLALFGTGSDEVAVSEVHPELGSGLAARIKADQATRRQAGTELAKNASISFSPSAKKTVRAGLLDIRPASFLVQLARTTRVYVIDIVCDSAETRAGRPCRTIVVSTGDMNMLQQTLSASALSYKPISVHEIDHDAVRLQWIPAIMTVAGG